MCCLVWIIWSCVILTADHFLVLFSCISALGWGLPSRGKPFLAGGRGGTWLERIPALPSLNVYFSAVTSRAFWDSPLAPPAFGLRSGRLFPDHAGLSPSPYWLCPLPQTAALWLQQLLQSWRALAAHAPCCFQFWSVSRLRARLVGGVSVWMSKHATPQLHVGLKCDGSYEISAPEM